MATVKLTDFMRDEIRVALIQSRFGDQFDAIRDRFAVLVDAVYNDVYEGVLGKMGDVPEGWLPKHDSIRVQIGDGDRSVVELEFNGEPHEWRGRGFLARRGPRRDNQYRVVQHRHMNAVVRQYPASCGIGQTYLALSRDWDDLCNDVEKAHNMAKQALKRVTTVAKLVSEWPEVRPFVAKWLEAPPAARLPAIAVGALNEVFDLPEDERKAA